MTEAQSYAIAGGMVGGMFVFLLAFWILLIIALWKIFEKAGEAGWKSLIPIYDMWILCKIIGVNFWIWILGIPFVGAILTAIAGGDNTTMGSIINIVTMIVVDIKLAINMSKSFGKSDAFTVGLVFLPNIFQLILGFGDSEYVGPNGEAK